MKPKLLILLLFLSTFCYATNTVNFKVEGKLVGPLKGKYAYLQLFPNKYQKSQLIQTGIVNGRFVFTGEARSIEGEYCWGRLFISDKPGFTSKTIVELIKLQNADSRSIALEENVRIEIGRSVIESAVIDGEINKINNDFVAIEAKRRIRWDSIKKKLENDEIKFKNDLDKKQQATAEYYQALSKGEEEYRKYLFELIRRYPNAKQSQMQFSGYVFFNDKSGGKFSKQLEELWENFPATYKESADGKKNRTILTNTKSHYKLVSGATIPDYTFNTGKPDPLSIKSYRGKYLFIDFWTSWCGPCRGEHHYMKKAYEKFTSDNFAIVQVSLDDKEDKWLKALKEENLPWTNFRCLKGWDKEVENLFDIKGVPTNYLVDPEGKIIARNLRGEALEQKLSEIFDKK